MVFLQIRINKRNYYDEKDPNTSRGKAFGYPKLIEKHSKALKKVTEALLKMVKKGE